MEADAAGEDNHAAQRPSTTLPGVPLSCIDVFTKESIDLVASDVGADPKSRLLHGWQ